MNSNDHPLAFPRSFAALFLYLGWFAQVITLAAFTAEAEWKFETRQNTSSEWWQTLSIQTVPGVVYHLQKCSTLDSGDWTNIATTYGTGGEWVCPIFPGSAPGVVPLVGTPYLPSGTATLHRFAYLILEKTTTGGTLISWGSLDDHTPRRMLLPGVVLDPVWEEFDSAYFNEHGNYLFALSPHFHTPVAFTDVAPTLGPLDTAMVAGFIAALPEITANIENSVAMASQFSPQPDNPGDKAFYRFSADWSVDSDGDGRYDWQEIILDGNNPFAVDSDGDGVPDQAAAATSVSNNLPTPTDSQGLTPLASLQQQVMVAHRGKAIAGSTTEIYTNLINSADDTGGAESLEPADSISAFAQAVAALSFKENGWESGGWSFEAGYEMVDAVREVNRHIYSLQRSRFRIKLDAPAPNGGYKIPLRIGKIRHSFDPENHTTELIAPTEGQVQYEEIVLEVAEGETEGIPNELSLPVLSENEFMTFIPAWITTRESDIIPEIDGVINPELAYPGPVDNDGACVPLGDYFIVDFGNEYACSTHMFFSPESKLHWRKRKLDGDGKFGEWSLMTMPGSMNIPHKGTHTFISTSNTGIYQMQALLVLSNGTQIEFPFVRMRDARSIVDSKNIQNPLLKAGAPDYFGVCGDSLSKYVRDAAVEWLGSTQYAKTRQIITEPGQIYNPDTSRSSKCNIFVTHVSNGVGATTPYYYRKLFIPTAPLAREDWFGEPEANIDLDSPGWTFMGVPDRPTPGMVVACPRAGGDSATSGHVGILDYDGSWINAGKLTVNKSVHLADESTDYKPNNMRSR